MITIGDTIKQKGNNPETFFVHKTLYIFEFEKERKRYAVNINRDKVFDYTQVKRCLKLLTEKRIFDTT